MNRRDFLLGGMAVIGGSAVGSPVKGILGANGAEYAGESKAEYTAKDYIQDGLVAMWDGIENVGWGKHDANTTVWKDLMGNCDITLVGVQIFNDHLFFSSTGVSYGSASFPTGYGAIEVVLSKSVRKDTPQYSCTLVEMGDVLYSGWGICTPYGHLTDTNDAGSAPYVLIDDKELFSASLNKNGKTTTSIAKNGMIGGSGTCAAGSRYEYANKSINFKTPHNRQSDIWFRCMRLYSHALTAEEIAYNYAIDKVRFGI